MGEVDQLVLAHPAGRDHEASQRGGVLDDLVAQGEESLGVQEEARHQGVAQHLVERDRAGMLSPRERLGETGFEERLAGMGSALPA